MCVSEGGEQGPHQRQGDVGNQLAGNGDGPALYINVLELIASKEP
jgi:hypothetical protein